MEKIYFKDKKLTLGQNKKAWDRNFSAYCKNFKFLAKK